MTNAKAPSRMAGCVIGDTYFFHQRVTVAKVEVVGKIELPNCGTKT